MLNVFAGGGLRPSYTSKYTLHTVPCICALLVMKDDVWVCLMSMSCLLLEAEKEGDGDATSEDGSGSSEGLQGQLGHSRDAVATGATPSNTGTKHHHQTTKEGAGRGPGDVSKGGLTNRGGVGSSETKDLIEGVEASEEGTTIHVQNLRGLLP